MVRQLSARVSAGVHLLCALLLVGVVACTTPQPSARYPVPAPYPPTPGAPPTGTVEAPPTGTTAQPSVPKPRASATLALQSDSQAAAASGDLPRAIQILERAIRISPDDPELWIELARLHLQDGNAAQAEQFARKALLFTGKRYDLEQQAWSIIGDARKSQG